MGVRRRSPKKPVRRKRIPSDEGFVSSRRSGSGRVEAKVTHSSIFISPPFLAPCKRVQQSVLKPLPRTVDRSAPCSILDSREGLRVNVVGSGEDERLSLRSRRSKE